MPKKNKPKTTVNVEAVKKDVAKLAKESVKQSPTDHVELAPGSVQRQSPLEQEMGTAKYKRMIHDHNDKNKHILDRLPFTFPKKKVVRSHLSVVVECAECGHQSYGSEYTIMKICSGCAKATKVINPEAETRSSFFQGEEEVGMFGSGDDLLELRERRRLQERERALDELVGGLDAWAERHKKDTK